VCYSFFLVCSMSTFRVVCFAGFRFCRWVFGCMVFPIVQTKHVQIVCVQVKGNKVFLRLVEVGLLSKCVLSRSFQRQSYHPEHSVQTTCRIPSIVQMNNKGMISDTISDKLTFIEVLLQVQLFQRMLDSFLSCVVAVLFLAILSLCCAVLHVSHLVYW
jgi:hypothetical protein